MQRFPEYMDLFSSRSYLELLRVSLVWPVFIIPVLSMRLLPDFQPIAREICAASSQCVAIFGELRRYPAKRLVRRAWMFGFGYTKHCLRIRLLRRVRQAETLLSLPDLSQVCLSSVCPPCRGLTTPMPFSCLIAIRMQAINFFSPDSFITLKMYFYQNLKQNLK